MTSMTAHDLFLVQNRCDGFSSNIIYMRFRDRSEAGQVLASQLGTYRDHPDALVLALPRGGVPVAYEVAKSLELPLDVFIVRKPGVPGHEELAMGAIATGGVQLLNEDVVRQLQIPSRAIQICSEKRTGRVGSP